jgi:putative heme-binding domain-containing protein
MKMLKVSVGFLLVAACAWGEIIQAQTPEWIWHDNKGVPPADNEETYFRKTFAVDGQVRKAVLTAAGDDQATLFLNGKRIFRNPAWNRATRADVTREIKRGENLIAAFGKNNSGDAAFIAKLEITFENDQTTTVITDTTWLAHNQEVSGWQQPGFDAAAWTKPVSRGKLGVMPWGDVMAPPVATAVDKIQAPPGFKIELLRSAEVGEGSWICMTVDPRGRLIISPQDRNQPLLRVTLSPSGQVEQVEPLHVGIGGAMGLLHAFDSLYVSGIGPNGTGLYRLRDTNQDDQFDQKQFLKKFEGGGEHGPHAIVLGPDNMLYIMNGNHTKVPEGISPHSPFRNYQEDLLLPRMWDAGGHAVGVLAPGGYVVRTDAEGKEWELFCAGFRNAYDLDFNSDGELFTFDSDMEWDWGTPWYRPTIVFHLFSGAEFGWRSGSGKWPKYYPDGLPGILDVGIGSPTGVKFGTGSKYPEKYQKAFYIADWSYGRILAVHLTPQGSSYSTSMEPFVSVPPGTPLNIADLEIGKDGAMYFITGGRGTQSGLYRVTYANSLPRSPHRVPESELLLEEQGLAQRAIRQRLESYHGKSEPAALDFIWRHLRNEDRRLRFAARVALEWQDLNLWRNRALSEKHPGAALAALTALARVGPSELQGELLESLDQIEGDRLSESQQLEALRVLSLAFIRMGKPDRDLAEAVMERLDRVYPAPSEALNRELAGLMIYLQAPGAISKTLELLSRAKTQQEQLHYIFALRNLKTGWNLEQRRTYFSWFNQDRSPAGHPEELIQWFKDVGRSYTDGASFSKFLGNIKKEAMETLTESEQIALAPILENRVEPAPAPQVAARPFVKEWTMADLVPVLDQASSGRNFQRGKEAYVATQCLACHQLGNEPGAGPVGPDLTAVSSRFTRLDLLESIIEPSKVVSEQYADTIIYTRDGSDITGRVLDETAEKLVVQVNPLSPTRVEIAKSDITRREMAALSSMPEGLINILTKEEILDLLAYIEAGGKKDAAAFTSGK